MIWLLIIVISFLAYNFFKSEFRNGKDAPFVPMDSDVVDRVMDMAKVGKNDKFYDLGSGDGRMVIGVAIRGVKSVGIESNIVRVLYSRFWIAVLGLGSRAKIIYGNFFDINLSGATVVSCYLLQETNDKLQKKLVRELGVGTKVVSIAFRFKGWKEDLFDLRGTIFGPIRMYKITKKMKTATRNKKKSRKG